MSTLAFECPQCSTKTESTPMNVWEKMGFTPFFLPSMPRCPECGVPTRQLMRHDA